MSSWYPFTIQGTMLPSPADTYDLGGTSNEWKNLYVGDAGGLYFGLSQDIYLERASAGVLILTTGAMDFNGKAVTNVGAAGNDFGASNSLVATAFSGAISNSVINANALVLGGASAEGGDIAVYTDGSGNLAMTLDADTGQLTLPVTGSGAGILLGGDVLVYRGAANKLYIADHVRLNTGFQLEFRDIDIYLTSSDDGHLDLIADVSIDLNGAVVGATDAITADTAGTAASLATVTTEVTTDGDQNLDDVTLADGLVGQIKVFTCVAEGDGADTWKVTPNTMNGGTQITFTGAVGEGCSMVYNTTVGWTVFANNGGTIA